MAEYSRDEFERSIRALRQRFQYRHSSRDLTPEMEEAQREFERNHKQLMEKRNKRYLLKEPNAIEDYERELDQLVRAEELTLRRIRRKGMTREDVLEDRVVELEQQVLFLEELRSELIKLLKSLYASTHSNKVDLIDLTERVTSLEGGE